MQLPVVGAGPQNPRFKARLGEGVDDAGELRGEAVGGDKPACDVLHLAFVLSGQVGADDLPAITLVGGLEHAVGSRVEGVAVVGRKGDGVGEGEAVLHVLEGRAVLVFRPDGDDAGLAC